MRASHNYLQYADFRSGRNYNLTKSAIGYFRAIADEWTFSIGEILYGRGTPSETIILKTGGVNATGSGQNSMITTHDSRTYIYVFDDLTINGSLQ